MKSIYFVLIGLLCGNAMAQIEIGLETGPVISGYNDVQIPREAGTRFSLTDDLNTDSKQYFRLNLNYHLSERDFLSVLVAPLSLHAEGMASFDILYEGVTFDANNGISAKYKFNSYRLTYRRTVFRNDKWLIGIGLTGKIRDAAIKLSNAGVTAEKANVGFVPLINFNLRRNLSDRFYLSLEGDALAAPQGRAEDVLVSINYTTKGFIESYVGYRMLEGGADVDEVYNFALLHYFAFGLKIRP